MSFELRVSGFELKPALAGAFGVNPKPETRNPKPETRNPKPLTRNPKPESGAQR